jgi:hypothetical protein
VCEQFLVARIQIRFGRRLQRRLHAPTQSQSQKKDGQPRYAHFFLVKNSNVLHTLDSSELTEKTMPSPRFSGLRRNAAVNLWQECRSCERPSTRPGISLHRKVLSQGLP